jgi:hypothetical protein
VYNYTLAATPQVAILSGSHFAALPPFFCILYRLQQTAGTVSIPDFV